MPDVTTLTLNNGVTMPALGLGVFQTPPDETRDAVTAALQTGYRHIDTAAAYGNERQVGEAVHNSGVDRSEVFLETKIWISDYGYDQTLHGFDKSARKLGVDQIDLLILHQALPSQFELTLEAYRALETLLEDGKVRAIEVSNLGAPGGMSVADEPLLRPWGRDLRGGRGPEGPRPQPRPPGQSMTGPSVQYLSEDVREKITVR
jgi:diketogulonate reductase-like aldo/keto reductase